MVRYKYSFKASGWFRIKNRGFVAVIEDKLVDKGLWNPDQLMNEIVRINGEDFAVKGVEKFMIGGISKENPYNLRFSLLVDEVTTTER